MHGIETEIYYLVHKRLHRALSWVRWIQTTPLQPSTKIRFYTILPSTTICRSKEPLKLRSPGEYFLTPFLQWKVVAKQEDHSLSVLRGFLFTLFLKARSKYGGRLPHRRPEDAPCRGDRERTCALSKCALLMEWWLMNSLNYRTCDSLLFIYVFEKICPYFRAIFT